jgi:uncharacterized membrane protein (UPF0127 family)
VGFEPTTPALRERCSGHLSYVGERGTSLAPPVPCFGMTPGRLARLESTAPAGGLRLHVATTWRARLLGLALLHDLPLECALLIPACRSVHTFGMRFALDVLFLDEGGRPLRIVRGLRPWRVVSCPGAAAVIERRAAPDGMIA